MPGVFRDAVGWVGAVFVASLYATASPAGDFFVKPAGSGAACTQPSPCTLATALASAGDGDRIYAGPGTYTGAATEVALVDRSLALLGGWNGAASGAVIRDPVAHESAIDGQAARRAVKILAVGVTLDGFTITNGNATGQIADCGGGNRDGCGGGILVTGTGVAVTNNRVIGNVASTAPAAGVQVIACGGGIMGHNADDLVIEGNTIAGNVAHTGNSGQGGGIAIEGCDRARVARNRVVDNTATTYAGDHGWGGGISITSYDVAIENNLLRGNRTNPERADDGNAIYTWYGSGSLRTNCVESDNKGSAVFLGYFAGAATGNRVTIKRDQQAVTIFNAPSPEPIELTNNILVGGSNTDEVVHVKGYWEYPVNATLRHNTIVGGGGTTAVFAGDYAAVTMSNNLLTGHITPLQSTAGGTITADHTLFWDVPAGIGEGANAIFGNPNFLNPAAGDFHIQEGSAARGAGIPAGVTADFEGDPRPTSASPDIGADQIGPRSFDFGTAASPVMDGAAQVTPATTYEPGRGFGWLAGTIDARDRGDAWNNGGRDFNFTRDGTFAVDLPNGRYWVEVDMGDLTTAHTQMGVYLEGNQVGVVSTAAGQYVFPSYAVVVADGQLTVRLKDLGGSDPNVVVNVIYIARQTGLRLDLGSGTSPVAQGFERVTSAVYSPVTGFGWTGGAPATRDRVTSDALLRDFVFTPRGRFTAFLENGDYDVIVTLGDAAASHDLMGAAVQGAELPAATTAKGSFATRRFPACVADNRLELLFDDGGGNDANVTVNAIEIVRPAKPFFDFGTAASPVSAGYQQVSEKTLHAEGRGYGWTAGAVGSRDRGTGSDLNRDFAFSADATFAADVVPGWYSVKVVLGDAAHAHDQVAVYLEGGKVATLSTAAGQFSTTSYEVQVIDGRLDLRIADEGGSDSNAAIVAVEIR